MAHPKVFLHVGEPKSGTTFVQEIIWGNRKALARQGVLLPGVHPQDHFRANQDLGETPQAPGDPTGSYVGEWDLLAKEALQADRVAVISHELLAAATVEQATRAIASLDGADVHIVLGIRDIVSLLPAEWQETVKHRNRQTYEEWLHRIRETDPGTGPWLGGWFWRTHNTPDVLRRWTAGIIPADHVHIVTLPPSGSPPDLLWRRFASVLGIDPATADLSTARQNASLGLAETEMLRRLNVSLGKRDMSAYFYAVHVKEHLAHNYLERRPTSRRPQLPPDIFEWAAQRCTVVIDALRDSGYNIVGSLDDLLPRSGHTPAADEFVNEPSPDEVLDAAIGAVATTLQYQYKPPPPTPQEIRLMLHPAARVAANPRVKRLIRDLSSRYPTIGRARVFAWHLAEHARSRRQDG